MQGAANSGIIIILSVCLTISFILCLFFVDSLFSSLLHLFYLYSVLLYGSLVGRLSGTSIFGNIT